MIFDVIITPVRWNIRNTERSARGIPLWDSGFGVVRDDIRNIITYVLKFEGFLDIGRKRGRGVGKRRKKGGICIDWLEIAVGKNRK